MCIVVTIEIIGMTPVIPDLFFLAVSRLGSSDGP